MNIRMIYPKELFAFINQLMLTLGFPDEDAACVATNLVTSSLRGIDSHGVGQLKLHVEGFS